MEFEISKELYRILKKMETDKIAKSILNIDCPQIINFVSLSKSIEANLSYLTPDRIAKLNPEEYWTSNQRYTGKPSRIIEKLFTKRFTDHQKQEFTTILKTNIEGTRIIKDYISIVEGDILAKYYHESSYYENKGGLGGSCMRHDKCRDYFDIYTKNPNQIKMAVVLNGDRIEGRCLLWYKNEDIYYDRIYAISDDVSRKMQSQLDNMDFINISDRNTIKADTPNITIKLDLGFDDIDLFPYLDTFQYITDNKISTYAGEITLRSQHGGSSDNENDNNEGYECDHCGSNINNGDIFIIGIGPGTDQMCCSDCVVYSEYYEQYILDSESCCTSDGGFILASDSIETYNNELHHRDEMIELYNGEYAGLNDNNLGITIDNEYFIEGYHNDIKFDGDVYYLENRKLENV